jgi:hypothetical protein
LTQPSESAQAPNEKVAQPHPESRVPSTVPHQVVQEMFLTINDNLALLRAQAEISARTGDNELAEQLEKHIAEQEKLIKDTQELLLGSSSPDPASHSEIDNENYDSNYAKNNLQIGQ